MGLEVVVCGQEAGSYEFLLEDVDKVQEVYRVATSDVVDGVWRWCLAHNAYDCLDDVVDVDEVSLAVAVVENLNLLSFDEFVGKSEVCHIRASCWAVDGEEAKAGGRDVVQLAVGVGHQFVAPFCRGVKRHRAVSLVIDRVWNLFFCSVH